MIRAVLSLTLLGISMGCRCPNIVPIKEAIEAAADSPSPYYVVNVLSEEVPKDINDDIIYELSVSTGCSTSRKQELLTCGNGACCGVPLKVGEKYALPLLKSGQRSRLSLCQSFDMFSRLTAEEKKLLSVCPISSPLTCNPKCRCVRAPCDCPPPCKRGSDCINGLCRPSCNLVKCVPGYKCEYGKCIPVLVVELTV